MKWFSYLSSHHKGETQWSFSSHSGIWYWWTELHWYSWKPEHCYRAPIEIQGSPHGELSGRVSLPVCSRFRARMTPHRSSWAFHQGSQPGRLKNLWCLLIENRSCNGSWFCIVPGLHIKKNESPKHDQKNERGQNSSLSHHREWCSHTITCNVDVVLRSHSGLLALSSLSGVH